MAWESPQVILSLSAIVLTASGLLTTAMNQRFTVRKQEVEDLRETNKALEEAIRYERSQRQLTEDQLQQERDKNMQLNQAMVKLITQQELARGRPDAHGTRTAD